MKIDNDIHHFILINNNDKRYVSFSRNCKAKTKEELQEKIQEAFNFVVENLKQHGIIPNSVTISIGRFFRKTGEDEIASDVKFELLYWDFIDKPIKDRDNTTRKIRSLNDFKELKNYHCKIFNPKQALFEIKPVAQAHKDVKINVIGETKQELQLNLVNSIWNILESNDITVFPEVELQVSNINATQTSQGLEAYYKYNLFRHEKQNKLTAPITSPANKDNSEQEIS